MALSNLTKVQTLGIGSNIEVVGVITTGQFKSGTSNLHSTGVELTNLNVSGIATIGGNLSIGGTLTYQDVTNIDSVGLITARAGVNVSGGQLDVGSNIKIGNAGVITATSFVGSGANLTSLPAQATIANNADNRVITGGSGVNLNGEANLTWNGTAMAVGHSNPNDTLHVYHATDNLVARFESGDTGGGITLKDNTHVTSLLTTNGAFEINVDQGGDISGETIAFKMSGSEKLRIESGGDVDIKNGVIKLASGAYRRLMYRSGNNDVLLEADAGDFYRQDIANSTHEFFTGNVERLRIASDGDVGIGTNSPVERFHVHKSSATGPFMYITNTSTGVSASDGIQIGYDGTNTAVFKNNEPTDSVFYAGSQSFRITSSGHVLPDANNTQDLGSSSKRWRNVYTTDLQLSNKGKTNDVDNTWGDYTIQEGESDLFLINNRNGKKYKFNLTEVS